MKIVLLRSVLLVLACLTVLGPNIGRAQMIQGGYVATDVGGILVTTPAGIELDSDLYTAYVGDLNADGKQDFYITGNEYRHVDDFIIVQGDDFNFSTISSPSPSEISAASTWPEAEEITIYRRDENGDGFLDFTLVHVDRYIPDLFQIVVLSDGVSGDSAQVTVPYNNKFWRLVHEVSLFLEHGAALVDVFNQPICIPAFGVTVAVPVLGSIPGTMFELPNGLQLFAFVQLGTGDSCIVLADSFLPETATLVNSQASFLAGGAINCLDCLSDLLGTISQVGKVLSTVIGLEEVALAALIRTAAIRTATVLIAGAITGGAVATAPALAILAGVSLAVINIDDLFLNDIGTPSIVFFSDETRPSALPDRFALQNTCDPKQPGLMPILGGASSTNLGKNLDEAGCGCGSDYSNAAAHHIVPLNDADTTKGGWGKLMREILADCDIDLDDARNGVCLPTKKNDGASAATIHNEAGTGLHTTSHYEALYNRLQNALDADGCTGVEDALEETRLELMDGIVLNLPPV